MEKGRKARHKTTKIMEMKVKKRRKGLEKRF